jgi:hypothetical protein
MKREARNRTRVRQKPQVRHTCIKAETKLGRAGGMRPAGIKHYTKSE